MLTKYAHEFGLKTHNFEEFRFVYYLIENLDICQFYRQKENNGAGSYPILYSGSNKQINYSVPLQLLCKRTLIIPISDAELNKCEICLTQSFNNCPVIGQYARVYRRRPAYHLRFTNII